MEDLDVPGVAGDSTSGTSSGEEANDITKQGDIGGLPKFLAQDWDSVLLSRSYKHSLDPPSALLIAACP